IARIELGIRASLAWSSEHRDLLSLFQFAATEERFAPALRRGQDIAIDDVVGPVKEGIVAGRIRDGDATLIAHAILGVTGHLSRVFIHEREGSTNEVADAAVSFCLEGVLARD
ncbi:MAG TPA: hypothetical protein PKA98_20665, partial [Acidimicrobiales bacterium]|nr:hypothetical protein [Acidimicrobiales bacterium]